MLKDDSHLWEQFARLGERIGDGDLDAHESAWMNKEYKRLLLILCPDIKKQYTEGRKKRNSATDEQMKNLISQKKCACGGILQQARSGSKVAYCINCQARYKASKKK